MVLVRETYYTITPESAAIGDFDETGFIDEEGTEYTFRELVDLLQFTEPSCFPIDNTPDKHLWFTTIDAETDYATGTDEYRSYHPTSDRAARYMVKAWKVNNTK